MEGGFPVSEKNRGGLRVFMSVTAVERILPYFYIGTSVDVIRVIEAECEIRLMQREVLVRRFGLNNHERTTLEDVGKELGVTRERVRQIQMDALKQLRKILENQGFTEELLFQD